MNFSNEDASGLKTGDGISEILKFNELVGKVEVDANVRAKPVGDESLEKLDDFAGGFHAEAGFGFEGENAAGGGGVFGAFNNVGRDCGHGNRLESAEGDADRSWRARLPPSRNCGPTTRLAGRLALQCERREQIKAGVGEMEAGVGFVPCGQVHAFFDALAVEMGHDECVDGDET